ncbi:hypothetical protein PsYK624_048310 [Phanerochaete sordida]|uniref:Uncharacterized protein n=1 Tax=Phanerochaete sordida TaxID=48140 RepID=A0A9P3G5P1_9APHY|nr:hypothetical protein PsYK624_048310 [Phanerochaete sordida]
MDLTQRTYSNLSELGDLSDSEWLDIPSSRASEDGDYDSDREDAEGRPASRHSFSSLASSSDEVVEGWEGLIEDGAEETPLVGTDQPTDYVFTTADGEHDVRAPSSEDEADPEDERVKAALDQSMMSTLSSSRSNSLNNSMQTSIVHSTRSLRLSFPDPTTSRLESLNNSFEQLSAEDAETAPSDGLPAPSEGAADVTVCPPEPEVEAQTAVDEHAFDAFVPPSGTAFDVILYGSSLMSKTAFIDSLLDKWALGSGLITTKKAACEPRTVVHTFKGFEGGCAVERTVAVIDKTGLDLFKAESSPSGRSLAVVFLPSFSELSLPDHTLYLPVMMASVGEYLGATDYLLEAEQQWISQDIPSSKLTTFSRPSFPIVEQDVAEDATCGQVEHALRRLSAQPIRKALPKVSAHAITIMTILSMVLAYIVNGTMSAPDARRFSTSAVTSPLLNLLRPDSTTINKSLSTPILAITSSTSAISLSSLKDFEMAIFKPSSSSPDVVVESTSQAVQPTASSSSAATVPAPTVVDGPAECECGCGLVTWPAKTETTELIIRPTGSGLSILTNTISSVSVIPSHIPMSGKGKGKAVPEDHTLYAVSTRMANALSEYFGFSPLAQAIATDVQELIVAVDQLAQAISRSAALALEQSRAAVAVLAGELRQRNERAKERAREIRGVGEAWVANMKEHLRARAQTARENAQRIKHRMSDGRKARSTRRAERRRLRQVMRAEKLERRAERMAEKVMAAA